MKQPLRRTRVPDIIMQQKMRSVFPGSKLFR